jgi:hypothetical protein
MGLRNVTDVFVKTNTVAKRVDDSTMCSETEHRLAGTGGRLNCVCIFGCGGCLGNRALDFRGPNSNWTCEQ